MKIKTLETQATLRICLEYHSCFFSVTEIVFLWIALYNKCYPEPLAYLSQQAPTNLSNYADENYCVNCKIKIFYI